MKVKIPKKFGNMLKISAIVIFAVYASLTSKVEKVSSLESQSKVSVTQKIVPYETIEQINENLDFMEQRTVQTGINGLTIEYNGVSIEIQKSQPEIIETGEKFIETFTGSITGYGPDCSGCGGKVGYGQDVRNGNIYFEDSKYGKLRIIAADSKYPYGSVFRISNANVLNEPVLAIVLDRGSNITGNKVDLLFESQDSIPSGITQNGITIDIVRLGF